MNCFRLTYVSNLRYCLGFFYQSVHFQLLSGTKTGFQKNIFGPAYISIIALTSIIAFVCSNRKKFKERYKDWKLHQNIHVKLKDEQSQPGKIHQEVSGVSLQYNNIKNNITLLNGLEIAFTVGLILLIVIAFIVHRWKNIGSENFYQVYVLKESIIMFFYNVGIPICYLAKKKELRKYIWEYTNELIH